MLLSYSGHVSRGTGCGSTVELENTRNARTARTHDSAGSITISKSFPSSNLPDESNGDQLKLYEVFSRDDHVP